MKKTKAVSHFVMPKNFDNPAGRHRLTVPFLRHRIPRFLGGILRRCLSRAVADQSSQLWEYATS